MSSTSSKRNFPNNDYCRSSEWLFCDHLRPTRNRSLIGCGRSLLSMEMSVFVDTERKMGVLSIKWSVFVDGTTTTKKR